jgi:adenosylcobinamide kinase/adenosylcobinamide-phosphate guanylyltransferase
MRKRIALHRRTRPNNWITVEAQTDMGAALGKLPKNIDGIIVECLGTYIANLMEKGLKDRGVIRDIEGNIRVLRALCKRGKKVFIVSNEVGSGIVPDTESGRRFRDIAGNINQRLAREADEVYLAVAGLPVRIKKEK